PLAPFYARGLACVMRALLLLLAAGLALGAEAQAEEACEPLPDDPAPPPMTLRPKSAASLQASRRLADPVITERFYFDDEYADREPPHNQVTDWQTRRSVLRLLEAARAEPANVAARTALAGALVRYIGDGVSFCDEPAGKAHDQALIRRWLLITLA